MSPSPAAATRTRPASYVRDALVLVIAVIPIVLVATTGVPADAYMFPVVGVLLMNCYAAVRLRQCLTEGASSALPLGFWLFIVVFFAGPFVVQVTSQTYPLDRILLVRPSGSSIGVAALSLGVGALGYQAGWAVAGRHRRRPRKSRLARSWDAPMIYRSVIVAVTLSVTAATIAIWRHGLRPFVTSRQAVEAAYFGTGSELELAFNQTANAFGGFELQITRYVTAVAFLGAVGARSALVHRRRQWRVACVVTFVPCMLSNGPTAASRTVFLSVLVGWWLVSERARVRPDRYGAIMVGGIIALTLMFPSLDIFRVSGQDVELRDPVTHYRTELDYSPVQQSMRVDDVVLQDGHTFGRQALGATLAFVPRSIWTDKPLSTTFVVSPDIGLVIGTPLWSEGYLEFGLVGAFGYCFLGGFALRRVASWTAAASSNPFVRSASAIGLGLVVLIVRGDLLSTAVSVYGLIGATVLLTIATRFAAVLGRPGSITRVLAVPPSPVAGGTGRW